jgi:hypothetical protein
MKFAESTESSFQENYSLQHAKLIESSLPSKELLSKSNITLVTDIIMMKYLKHCRSYQNVTYRHEMSTRCWKNGADRLVRRTVAANLHFIKRKRKIR